MLKIFIYFLNSIVDLFEEADSRKFQQVWKMNESELLQLVQRYETFLKHFSLLLIGAYTS